MSIPSWSWRTVLLGAALAAIGLAPGTDRLARAEPAAAGDAGTERERAVGYAARTMGTYGRVTIVTADSIASMPHALAAHRAFQRVDSLMSNWTTTSEVARLNRVAFERKTRVQDEVAEVLAAALTVGRESGGAFDITVEPLVRAWGFLGGTPAVPDPSEVERAFALIGAHQLHYEPVARTLRFERDGVKIDLGGIAKGHAVDRAAASLAALGVRNALIDLSGNMVALGGAPGRDHWRVGIRDPRDRVPYVAQLRLSDRAVATSGKYEQFVALDGKTYGHILDPRSGRPAEGLISVTVVAESAMLADAWGTALFVLGADAAKRIARSRDDLDAVLIEPGDTVDVVWVERSLMGVLAQMDGTREHVRVEYF